jgi:hypothetical protein
MTITNAYLVTNFKIMIPVKIKIGAEYLVVTTVSKKTTFTTKPNSHIPL